MNTRAEQYEILQLLKELLDARDITPQPDPVPVEIDQPGLWDE